MAEAPPITTETHRCKARSSRTGKQCRAYAIRGGVVCSAHGGRAPQVIRKAEERLAGARDDALTALAYRLGQQVKELDSNLIDTRDLLSSVKELTTLAELLAGRATDRLEITEVRTIVAAVVAVAGRFVAAENREQFLLELERATAGLGGEA